MRSRKTQCREAEEQLCRGRAPSGGNEIFRGQRIDIFAVGDTDHVGRVCRSEWTNFQTWAAQTIEAPHIHYNFFDDQNDLDRLLEVVRLSRKVGRTAPFSDLIDHEMAPGNAVDNDEALRANIVANVAGYLHGTSTVPMGADSDPTAVVDAWGKVRGIKALRVVDASILPEIPSVETNVTTIMLAERIAAKLSGEDPSWDSN
jgi:choline dehydrogenase-like flavoprotein